MPRVGKPELRQELLNAGLRCFARRGYHAATMDEIAAEAGVSKGAIYWHFKDKQELFLSIMRERGQALEAAGAVAVQAFSPDTANAADMLRALIIAIFRYYHENRDFASLLGLLRSGKDAPFGNALYEELTGFYRKARAQLVPLFEFGTQRGEFDETPPDILATWMLATVDGTVMQWVIDPEEVDLMSVAVILSLRFARAVRKETSNDSHGSTSTA